MVSKPKVSIIIPTFNRSNFLQSTLESISKQTFKDFEVIVVDDGSPSNEAELVCREFNFCHYEKIENSGGPATPRNKGINLARGKYLAFVDDDDLWYPEKLELQVDILEKEPDFGLVHSYCDCIDEKGNLTGAITGRPGSPEVKHGDCFIKMIGNWTVMMPTPLIRTELVKKIKGFNPFISKATEDVEFFTRLSLHTKFWFIDKALVQYRVHGGNISGNNENYKNLPISLSRVAEDAYLDNRITLDDLFLIQRRLYFKFSNYDGKHLLPNVREARLKILKRSYSFWDRIRFIFFGLRLNLKIALQAR
ncbi:glycosyltransferase [Algoriphagus sp. AK58]|uniref:glycosyltransferase family 2 protein n=1 Tax=Algoriphagus sp. AK58 TaxID=1406877 RepID=UPI00164FE225